MGPPSCAPPSVTAAVVCYNHAQFVVEALESVKAQAYPNLQLVVLDDCSSDDSVVVIRRWLDQHCPDSVFVAHETNMGPCRTFNDALANAKGKYIRFLAADDRWAPNTLSRQVEVMETVSEDIGVLYSNAFQIDEGGHLLPGMFIEDCRQFAEMPEGRIFNILMGGNFIPGMTALIRRRCFEAVGGFDESLAFEDWDMWLRISRQFEFKYFPEPTAYYRLLLTSMIRTQGVEIDNSERRIVARHLRGAWMASENGKETAHSEYLKARLAYRYELPDPALKVAWALRHRISIKHALLLLFVVLRLPYRRFNQLAGLLGKMSRRARSLRANGENGRVPG